MDYLSHNWGLFLFGWLFFMALAAFFQILCIRKMVKTPVSTPSSVFNIFAFVFPLLIFSFVNCILFLIGVIAALIGK